MHCVEGLNEPVVTPNLGDEHFLKITTIAKRLK